MFKYLCLVLQVMEHQFSEVIVISVLHIEGIAASVLFRSVFSLLLCDFPGGHGNVNYSHPGLHSPILILAQKLWVSLPFRALWLKAL